MQKNWVKEFGSAITVCDKNGTILEMNAKALKTFEKYGKENLIGRNLSDCHPEPAKSKLKKMLAEPITNCYTIEKNGIKKIIYQAPWYDSGEYGGFVEISMEIPLQMPHYVRK